MNPSMQVMPTPLFVSSGTFDIQKGAWYVAGKPCDIYPRDCHGAFVIIRFHPTPGKGVS